MHTEFFLGANSGRGFRSFCDEFCSSDGDMLYLIKAGPGGGKSGFMRRIAQAAEAMGYDLEYILCSGDQDSLDGVYIPALKLGFADATAPHVAEPRRFGYDSCYVNLGQFCRRSYSEDIPRYQASYKSFYERAYALLNAAAAVKSAPIPGLITEAELDKCRKRAKSTVMRELGTKPHGSGKLRHRLISAISCRGEIVLSNTVNSLCKQIYLLDDRCGLAACYLETVIAEAQRLGESLTVCPSPLLPDKPEAVLLPERSLGFVSSAVMRLNAPYRHVRLDALIPDERLRQCRPELRRAEKTYRALIDEAVLNLSRAKRQHDLLEAAYRPYMDFEALTGFTDEFAERLLG